jgi:hypothetical protein
MHDHIKQALLFWLVLDEIRPLEHIGRARLELDRIASCGFHGHRLFLSIVRTSCGL